MAGRQRFGKLKDHATKTFKFDQTKLINQADEMRVNLELLMRGIDTDKWSGYSSTIGACSIFAGIWLADRLRGRMEMKAYMALTDNRQKLVVKSIGANAELKETADSLSNALLVRKLNLQVGMPSILKDLSDVKSERRSQYFFVACEGTNRSNAKITHAVAYSHRGGGTFFDPNAGEYINVAAKAFMFFQEWDSAYNQDVFNHAQYDTFICYPVA